MQLKLRKSEVIVFLVIFMIGLAGMYYIYHDRMTHDYGSFRITVNGQEYGTYSLGKNTTIRIGDTNICQVQDGQVRMIEAQCPDHLCMNQLPVDEHGGQIICLPNKVVISGIQSASSASELELDGITG